MMFRNSWSALPIVVSLVVPLRAVSQLTVTPSVPAVQVVQNVLLGPGITASNVSFLGVPSQLGTFNGVNCNVGLDAGMIMATGPVTVALGPNNSSGAGVDVLGPSDPDLDVIVHDPNIDTHDRAVLEFDFVPDGDSLRFRFVFGSEEYLEFVGSINDVFGFFLSGPGITGPYSGNSRNLAMIPGTAYPVSINNVNNVLNSAYYIDNTGNGPQTIQFDGFTTAITATAKVVCGETYHIKIAIADASDGILDSGVFLEAGSFSSNSIQLVSNITAGGADSVLYEGCGTAQILVERQGNSTVEQTVDLFPSGTTTIGIDHGPIPAQLIFPPGETSIALDVAAFADGEADGPEYLDVRAVWQGDCASDTTTLRLYFDDAPEIFVTIDPDTTLTCSDSTLVQAQVSGGFGAYSIDWSSGIPDNAPQGWVAPSETTTYTVNVTDECGVFSASAEMTITIPVLAPLVVSAGPDTTVLCPASPVMLQSAFSGGTPLITTQWSNGGGTDPFLLVMPASTTSWTVTVTDRCGTTAMDQVTVIVQYDTVRIVASPDTSICLGDTVMLRTMTEAGAQPWQWIWIPFGATTDSLEIHPDVPIHHVVRVTDGCGISATDTIAIGVNDPLAAFRTDGSVLEDGLPIQFVDQSSPTLGWWWDFGDGTDAVTERHPQHIFDAPGEYGVRLAIIDTLGCVDTLVHSITVHPGSRFFLPNGFSPDGDGINERFGVVGRYLDVYRLRIFDRWGALVFETVDPSEGWDGTVKGVAATPGVYVYQVRYKDPTTKAKDLLGHVTLLR